MSGSKGKDGKGRRDRQQQPGSWKREMQDVGEEEEEGLNPGQAKPGVKELGRMPPASVRCSICLSTGAVRVFHSIRLAGLPRASCPLGSLSMSGGGRRWRKQLQE